jgi:hypothetical protein
MTESPRQALWAFGFAGLHFLGSAGGQRDRDDHRAIAAPGVSCCRGTRGGHLPRRRQAWPASRFATLAASQLILFAAAFDIVLNGELEATNYFSRRRTTSSRWRPGVGARAHLQPRPPHLRPRLRLRHIAVRVDDLDGTLASLAEQASSLRKHRTRSARAARASASSRTRTVSFEYRVNATGLSYSGSVRRCPCHRRPRDQQADVSACHAVARCPRAGAGPPSDPLT